MSIKKDQLNNLIEKIEKIKNKGKRIGFTNGCFDLLHKGHRHILKESKKNCDFLIVGLNSDASVKKLKGLKRPIEKQKNRLKNLESLNCVDEVIIFDELTPINLIKKIIPNILIKGSDYKDEKIIGFDFVRSHGGEIIIIDLLSGFSTTNIINERKLE